MFQVIPRQKIHMKKNRALFSSKDKSEKLKCRLLQFLFGALRVNIGYSVTLTAIYFPRMLEAALTDQLMISLNPAKTTVEYIFIFN